MKTLTLITFVLLSFFSNRLYAQNQLIDGYFDYTVGNKWQFRVSKAIGTPDELVELEIESCQEADSLTVCNIESRGDVAGEFGKLKIYRDSLLVLSENWIVEGNIGPAELIINDAGVLEPRTRYEGCFDCSDIDYVNYVGVLGYMSKYETIPQFGENIELKVTTLVQLENVDDDPSGQPGLGLFQFEYAKEIGFVNIRIVEGDQYLLRGAVINGDTLGYVRTVSNEKHNVVAIPESFEIVSTYPNPFNPSFSITIQNQTPTHLSLRIYDMVGRLQLRRDLGYHGTGVNTIGVNTDGLASGQYILSLKAGAERATHIITKIKSDLFYFIFENIIRFKKRLGHRKSLYESGNNATAIFSNQIDQNP